jgi:hypothetical protein
MRFVYFFFPFFASFLDSICPSFPQKTKQQDRHESVEKSKILYGMSLGATATSADEDEGITSGFGTRVVKTGQRVRCISVPMTGSLTDIRTVSYCEIVL